MAAASLSIGVSWSPLLASTGVLMGLRGAASMLAGRGAHLAGDRAAAVARGAGRQPRLLCFRVVDGLAGGRHDAAQRVPAADPGLALGVAIGARSVVHAPRAHARRGARAPADSAAEDPASGCCLVALVLVVHATFGMHPLMTLAALAISVITGGLCARAAGETDFAPVGQLGTAMQLGFGAAERHQCDRRRRDLDGHLVADRRRCCGRSRPASGCTHRRARR